MSKSALVLSGMTKPALFLLGAPPDFHKVERHHRTFDSLPRVRLTADIISQFSEKEAVQIYKTVMGEVG